MKLYAALQKGLQITTSNMLISGWGKNIYFRVELKNSEKSEVLI